MHQVPDSAIGSWNINHETKTKLPALVDASCPHCGRLVAFTLAWETVGKPPVCFTVGRCPGCRSNATFIVLDFTRRLDGTRAGICYMDPSRPERSPSPDIATSPHFTDALKRAYTSAVSCHNHAEWNATAVACRRFLEGMTLAMMPNDGRRTLAQRLRKLPEHVDLAKPILGVAQALKDGGNLGAHFALNREPDNDMAGMMLDLLEDLVDYLFVLPDKIERLNARIDALPPREPDGA